MLQYVKLWGEMFKIQLWRCPRSVGKQVLEVVFEKYTVRLPFLMWCSFFWLGSILSSRCRGASVCGASALVCVRVHLPLISNIVQSIYLTLSVSWLVRSLFFLPTACLWSKPIQFVAQLHFSIIRCCSILPDVFFRRLITLISVYLALYSFLICSRPRSDSFVWKWMLSSDTHSHAASPTGSVCPSQLVLLISVLRHLLWNIAFWCSRHPLWWSICFCFLIYLSLLTFFCMHGQFWHFFLCGIRPLFAQIC